MMWYGGTGWGWGGWFMMAAMMVVFWGLVIAAGFAAVRYLSPNNPPRPGATDALERKRAEDILAERYARGEIDDDEYRKRLTLLREHQA